MPSSSFVIMVIGAHPTIFAMVTVVQEGDDARVAVEGDPLDRL